MGLFFLVIILNIGTNKKSVISLEYKWLNYLGKLSYSMYMYHMIVIGGVLQLVSKEEFDENIVTANIVVYVLTLLGTIVLSSLSYRFFERPFLNFKDRFALMKTSSDGNS